MFAPLAPLSRGHCVRASLPTHPHPVERGRRGVQSRRLTFCFNPLRGTWPRRIRRDCTRGPRSCVSIRSAAHGRGECSTYRRSMISFPFQSAPRHMAAENGPILLDLPNRGSFNPLRGTWPRRMLWLSPTDQCQNVSIRSAAHGRGECSCYNSSPTMHFMGGFREHRFQQGACLRNPRSTYA